jgi:superfamily II DNA/RNA helicase
VQAACIPRILSGESFRALAPTGTGKTLVYLLRAWQLREESPRSPAAGKAGTTRPGTARPGSSGACRTLIVVPVRELGYQVSQMLRELDPSLAKGTVAALGGHDRADQIDLLARDWKTLIATPGRLLDLMGAGAVDLRGLSLLVLDEFDKLVGMGFAEQIAEVLKKVPKDAQRILLSATDQEAGAAEALGLGGLETVAVERAPDTRSMEEAFYFLKSDKKKNDLLLGELATARGQVMVFTGNREKANHLNGLLKLRGFPSRVLHGRMIQSERAAAYQEFRSGAFKVLVATDLASRGLDMPEVDVIVNFDLPKHYKDYVHRTGRAARRGRAGRCVSYAGPHEFLAMRNLEAEFPGTLPIHPDFAQRETWFRDAKRLHDREVGKEERRQRIRREQGIDEEG